jgi:lipoprotein-releasing system permease protein
MQLPFEVIVALRYMRSRRKAGISLTSFLTVVAFTLGVAALTVVTSVWNGFEAEFLDKLLGINAHTLVLRRHDVFRDHREVASRLGAQPGVTLVSPFVYSEVIVQSASAVQGVVIKGVDPELAARAPLGRYVSADAAVATRVLGDLRAPTSTLGADAGGLPGVLLGEDLMEVLRVSAGDPISVISPHGGGEGQARTGAFRVAGAFDSGMYEFDSRMVFVDLAEAQRFFGLFETVTGLEVWTADPLSSAATLAAATRGLDPEDPLAFDVKDWSVTNQGIFGAMHTQKLLISIVLFVIVVVAAFMITATLTLLILEKRREVAVLKALGAADRSILRVFVLDGLIVGVAGCLAGVAVGLLACALLERHGLKLDPRVYYLERLPVLVRPAELLAVAAGALALAVGASALPARRAARMAPVDGLTRREPGRPAARSPG